MTKTQRSDDDSPEESQPSELTARHASAYDEALAGQEADGGESVLGGMSRESQADWLSKDAEQAPTEPSLPNPKNAD